MLFLVLVTSTKHYWVVSAERRRGWKTRVSLLTGHLSYSERWPVNSLKWPHYKPFRSSEKGEGILIYIRCARDVLERGRELGRDSAGFQVDRLDSNQAVTRDECRAYLVWQRCFSPVFLTHLLSLSWGGGSRTIRAYSFHVTYCKHTNARTAKPSVCPPPMYKIMYKKFEGLVSIRTF